MPKGIYFCSDARREACRNAQLGNTNSLGCRRSIETRRRMSEAKKNNMYVGCQQGEKNHAHKLIEKEVLEIKQQRASAKYLAAKYDICEGHVRNIWRGDSWKHL